MSFSWLKLATAVLIVAPVAYCAWIVYAHGVRALFSKRGLRAGAAFVGSAFVFIVLLGARFGPRVLIGPDKRSLTGQHFERTPQRLARGKYLAENVMLCFRCHNPVDWSKPGTPPMAGTKGSGQIYNEGTFSFTIPNITPDVETGAGRWTDDMFARAIREGIAHDGRALFNAMPYSSFGYLTDEDLAALVVYIRSLPPVRNRLPEQRMPVRFRLLARTLPHVVATPVRADLSTPANRGAYLVRIALCGSCHTPYAESSIPPGMEFSGGVVQEGGFGRTVSLNLTPDPTGIVYLDEARFLTAMRTGKIGARVLNPNMPWGTYRNMSDEDLKDIFAFLKSLKPVRHLIDPDLAPTYCRKCWRWHGGGSKN